MSSVNKVILIGNLCADPSIKSFQNGGRVANLRVATSERWRDKKSGEQKERAEFHNVTINGDGLVGVVERFLKKGSKVFIEGKLTTRKYSDAAGNDRYTTEVVIAGMGGQLVMLDGPKGDSGGRPQGGGSGGSSWNDGPHSDGWGGGGGSPSDDEDEIPF